jgi:hypothetical protein
MIMVDSPLYERVSYHDHVRRVLVAELGTEPGGELRELHRHILSPNPVQLAPEVTSAAGSKNGTRQ